MVDVSGEENRRHWLKVYDWAEDKIAALEEEIKEYKAKSKEAQEQFLDGIEDNWKYIKIDGRAVFSRESKLGQKRVYVDDLKELHPDIYAALAKQKPTTSVKRIR